MSYLTIADIAESVTMYRRIRAAATEEKIPDPQNWVSVRMWDFAASPGWGPAWDSALAGHPDDPEYDPGADPGVITDGMILSAVQLFNPAPAPAEPEVP